LCPGPLYLALELVALGCAATLELTHVDAEAIPQTAQLALGGLAAPVRTDRARDGVTGSQPRTDRDQDRALSLGQGRLDARRLGPDPALGRPIDPASGDLRAARGRPGLPLGMGLRAPRLVALTGGRRALAGR
jgi:hypothetical protein